MIGNFGQFSVLALCVVVILKMFLVPTKAIKTKHDVAQKNDCYVSRAFTIELVVRREKQIKHKVIR